MRGVGGAATRGIGHVLDLDRLLGVSVHVGTGQGGPVVQYVGQQEEEGEGMSAVA